jgi:small subunit ribosomal protein S20
VLGKAIPYIDKAASKGVIHKATASRKISRLAKLINTEVAG